MAGTGSMWVVWEKQGLKHKEPEASPVHRVAKFWGCGSLNDEKLLPFLSENLFFKKRKQAHTQSSDGRSPANVTELTV